MDITQLTTFTKIRSISHISTVTVQALELGSQAQEETQEFLAVVIPAATRLRVARAGAQLRPTHSISSICLIRSIIWLI